MTTTFDSYMTSLNPLLWYKLNETSGTTATDSGSGSHNGTYSGGFTLSQTGPPSMPGGDTGVLFNGSTGQVATSFDPSSTGDFTFVCWFKGVPSIWAPALLTTNNAFGQSAGILVALGTLSGTPTIEVFANISGGVGKLSLTLTATTYWTSGWHMLTVVFKSGIGMWAFIDGYWPDSTGSILNFVSTSSSGGLIAGGVGGLKVAGPYGSDSFYGGSVAQVAFWQSALSGLQISQLFQLGAGGSFDQYVIAQNPFAWWKGNEYTFNSTTGAVASFDSSGTAWIASGGTTAPIWGTNGSGVQLSESATTGLIPVQSSQPCTTNVGSHSSHTDNITFGHTSDFLHNNPIASTTGLTIASAFKTSYSSGVNPGIVCATQFTGATNNAYGVGTWIDASGHFGCWLMNGSSNYTNAVGSTVCNDNNPHLAVVTLTDNGSGTWTAVGFLDGVQKATASLTGCTTQNLNVLDWGALAPYFTFVNQADSFFDGYLAHAQVYSGAMTPTQVAALATAAGFTVPTGNKAAMLAVMGM